MMKRAACSVAICSVLVLAGCSANEEKERPLGWPPQVPYQPTDKWFDSQLPVLEDKADGGVFSDGTPEDKHAYKVAKKLYDARKLNTERARSIPGYHRDNTLHYGNNGRGGAAFRQPSYIHVMGDGNLPVFESSEPDPKSDKASDGSTPGNFEKSLKAAANTANEVKGTTSESPQGHAANVSYSYYEMSRWGRYCDNGLNMDRMDWDFVNRESENIPSVIADECNTPFYTFAEYRGAWESYCHSDHLSDKGHRIIANTSPAFNTDNCDINDDGQ